MKTTPLWLGILPASLILQLADFSSTYLGLEVIGHIERNPFALAIINAGWVYYLLVKMLVTPAFMAIAYIVTRRLSNEQDREITLTYTAILWYAASLSVITYNLAQYA